jgi:hypothetical protein
MQVWRSSFALVFLGLFLAVASGGYAAEPVMHEVAVKAERPAGAPEYADVCFRYGWIRKEFPTVDDAKKAIRAFHATRVDWFYPGPHSAEPDTVNVTDAAKDFIDWCHDNGMKVGGAINTLTFQKAWKAGNKTNHGRFIGDPANPDYIKAVVTWGKAQIDAGVDTLVCDDLFGYSDNKQRKLFSDNVISAIKAHKKGFRIAANHGGFIHTGYVTPYAFDFHYSDNNFVPRPSQWWSQMQAHRASKSAVLVHPNTPVTKQTHRAMIALAYAAGAHVITPWDEYIHGGRKRLFANPADFADLYGFVRSLGQTGYLNGYEDAAVGGDDLKETRYGETPPITVHGGSGKLSIFARAKPGEADAPVVIHVVESGESQPATLHGRKGSVPGFGYYILLHQEFLVFAPPRDISPFAHAD